MWELGPAEVIAACALILAAVSARYARQAKDAAEASAAAAKDSAQADTTLARLAEEEREAKLAPNLHVTQRPDMAQDDRRFVFAHNIGPQDWDNVEVELADNEGADPPLRILHLQGWASEGPLNLGGMPHDSSARFVLHVWDQSEPRAARLVFRMTREADAKATVLERRIRVSARR